MVKQTAMELYWIVPRRCAESNQGRVGGHHKKVPDDYIIFFEDLVNLQYVN